jgi:hypothetical protein
MRKRFLRLLLVLLAAALVGTTAQAQTTSVSGIVVDSDNRVVPGAAIVVKNARTGTTFETVSSAAGTFAIPAVPTGTYTITVSLPGFKTAVLTDVVANVGGPASVRATLEVGTQSEMISVEAKAELVQTQASAVSTTLEVNQITNLPLTSRSVLDFVTLLPGVNTPGGNRNSMINGLPQSQINITLDGINVQDNTLKGDRGGDGFFAIVNPRLDAIDEVTMSSAGLGAESSGQGALQIRFVTRSGTNQFQGSAYHYLRKDEFNANTWFNDRNNIAKPALLQNQFGMRVGGPITIPGLFNGRDRAFFFINYEEFRQPSDVTRNRTILHPLAQQGVFRYNVAGQVREVNLLSLAASSGQLSTADPAVAKLLSDIRAATGTTGRVIDLADPLFQRYSYNVPARAHNRYPTLKLDWDITSKHRASIATNYQRFLSVPDTLNGFDPQFPGFPATGSQSSERLGVSANLRSTLGSNLINDLLIGGSGAPVQFFKELNTGMWGGTSVADQVGHQLNIGGAPLNLTNAAPNPVPQSRNASVRTLENRVNWITGAHNLTFGASYSDIKLWLRNQTLVPTVNFGIVSGDPADALFNATNFPGASAANLTAARQLYAVLTGRISSITGNAGLNEDTGLYEYMGRRMQRARLRDLGFYVQDNWRIRPNLSLNLGLRYEVQMPFEALNNSYSSASLADAWGVSGLAAGCDASSVSRESCNIFKAGTLQGSKPQFVQLQKGVKAFNTDLNNIAPSIGFNWTPSASGGLLRTLLGQSGDTSIRGGFSRAFSRAGLTDFTTPLSNNPGVLITADRSAALGNLGPLPLVLRDRSRLGPPAFQERPIYPMTDVITGDVNTFDPNLKTPYSDSWSVGIQRAIGRDMAVEVRYLGTRSRDLWTVYNYNEVNFVDNGFLNEFKLAQQNLAANIAAGRGNTFAYTGVPGTSPLPIFLAYLNGASAANAGDPSRYTSPAFADNTFRPTLARMNPNPRLAADTLDADAARRNNALAAGLPANFLVANPDLLGGANVTGNGGGTRYHSLQFELRRRFAKGLQFGSSYALAKADELAFYSFRKPFRWRPDAANARVNPVSGLTVAAGGEGNVRHAFKAYWTWDLPFGKGRRFASGAGGVFDRIVGGWQIHGSARLQSGYPIDFGNVRLVGFDKNDLGKMFKLRTVDNPTGGTPRQRVYVLPQDVIDNTVKAFSVSETSPTGYGALGPPSGRYFAPANGPDCIELAGDNNFANTDHLGFGDCGVHSVVASGPMFKNVDLSLTKIIRFVGRTRLEFHVEALNVFNTPNFIPVVGVGANPNDFEITQLTGANTARTVQLVTRFTW